MGCSADVLSDVIVLRNRWQERTLRDAYHGYGKACRDVTSAVRLQAGLSRQAQGKTYCKTYNIPD